MESSCAACCGLIVVSSVVLADSFHYEVTLMKFGIAVSEMAVLLLLPPSGGGEGTQPPSTICILMLYFGYSLAIIFCLQYNLKTKSMYFKL